MTGTIASSDELLISDAGTIKRAAFSVLTGSLGTAAVLDVGISDDNVPKFTSGVVDNDFLRVDGTKIEGRSAGEVLSDIGACPVQNYVWDADEHAVTHGNSGTVSPTNPDTNTKLTISEAGDYIIEAHFVWRRTNTNSFQFIRLLAVLFHNSDAKVAFGSSDGNATPALALGAYASWGSGRGAGASDTSSVNWVPESTYFKQTCSASDTFEWKFACHTSYLVSVKNVLIRSTKV
jgi:hypothetical protein